jgi:hypothetical protein
MLVCLILVVIWCAAVTYAALVVAGRADRILGLDRGPTDGQSVAWRRGARSPGQAASVFMPRARRGGRHRALLLINPRLLK